MICPRSVLGACLRTCLWACLTVALPLQTKAAERAVRAALMDVGTAAAPMRLWVEERGHGEPIVMLHGFGSSTYTWRYIASPLSRTHRVIAVDLKGAGRSDKPFDDAYRIVDQVALLKAVIVHKHLSRVTLVGHSFGGGVALALALDLNRTRPDTLARLVLIDSIDYPQPLPLFMELLKTPVLAQVGLLAMLPEMESYKGLLATYLDPSKITWDAVRAYALPLYELGGRYALVETAKEMIPTNLPKLIAGYPTIHQPTLLVWCAEDSIVPAWVGHRLAHDLSNARLSLIHGCGHAPQEELPKTTLALIRGFLP